MFNYNMNKKTLKDYKRFIKSVKNRNTKDYTQGLILGLIATTNNKLILDYLNKEQYNLINEVV